MKLWQICVFLVQMEQKRLHDDRLDIARRLYDALCGQYPDQFIILCMHKPAQWLATMGLRLRQPQLRQFGEVRRRAAGLIPRRAPQDQEPQAPPRWERKAYELAASQRSTCRFELFDK
jgi:hypothetical protein